MLNIFRKLNPEPAAPALAVWDPVRWMKEGLNWDLFREIGPVLPAALERANTFVPAFEVKETPESFILKADLPEVEEKDLVINLFGNRLTVVGKREAEKENTGDTFYTCERTYGAFRRVFTLPEGVDLEHVTAILKNGVLTIAVPKGLEVQPRKIPVKVPVTQS